MTTQMTSVDPLPESQGIRSVRQMKQLVGLLFNSPSIPATTVPIPTKSKFYVPVSTQESPPTLRQQGKTAKHNVCAYKDSITSTDSGFAWKKDESSESSERRAESVRSCRRRNDSDLTLPLGMKQCSVTEKVQRWKETMAGKAKSAKLEKLGSLNETTKNNSAKIEDEYRDSLDSGLNSLSGEGHRDSLFIHQSCVGPVSPLNGELDVDDTLTSVLSSLASDIEADSSDIEDSEDKLKTPMIDSSLMMRCTSVGSCSSGGDEEIQMMQYSKDEITLFMDTFVDQLFDDYESISRVDKANFGVMARLAEGRNAFARALNAKRDGHQRIQEDAFFSLVLQMAVVLFECFEANDWSPAKVLMNMCFTFYSGNDHEERDYLYSYLASQRIWKSSRFWNSAFFEAILSERAKFNLPTETINGITQVPDKESQRQCLENITFSQLATFTHNMHAFGLPQEFCFDFLDKQVVIGNLPEGQVELLRENIERIFKEPSQKKPKN